MQNNIRTVKIIRTGELLDAQAYQSKAAYKERGKRHAWERHDKRIVQETKH